MYLDVSKRKSSTISILILRLLLGFFFELLYPAVICLFSQAKPLKGLLYSMSLPVCQDFLILLRNIFLLAAGPSFGDRSELLLIYIDRKS